MVSFCAVMAGHMKKIRWRLLAWLALPCSCAAADDHAALSTWLNAPIHNLNPTVNRIGHSLVCLAKSLSLGTRPSAENDSRARHRRNVAIVSVAQARRTLSSQFQRAGAVAGRPCVI